jgi:hypothetical protein
MIAHTTAEIERELRLGRTPQTDNRSALITLGFEPAMPQVRDDTTWIRPVEVTAIGPGPRPARAVKRVFALQRAEFVAWANIETRSQRSALPNG